MDQLEMLYANTNRKAGISMDNENTPVNRDFWLDLFSGENEDPAFLAATLGTVYRPSSEVTTDGDDAVPPDKPFGLPQEEPPVPPDTWPGL